VLLRDWVFAAAMVSQAGLASQVAVEGYRMLGKLGPCTGFAAEGVVGDWMIRVLFWIPIAIAVFAAGYWTVIEAEHCDVAVAAVEAAVAASACY
jgi:hypothetical protein